MSLFKNSKETSDESTKKIQELFYQATGEDTYHLVYAYSMKSSLFGKKIGSYILGLSSNQAILKIIPFDLFSEEHGTPISLNKEAITSAKRTLQGNTIIDSPTLQKKLKLIIPPFTPKNAENMLQLPINQEKKEALFRAFFNEIH